MDFDLSDEQQLIRDTAREFTDREIVARAKQNARDAHFDVELVGLLAAQGYLGAIVPREYGGAGLDYVTYALVVEEIGRGDSAMRTVISVQTSLVCGSILAWGTRGAEGPLPAQALLGRVAGLLRPDRARGRLGRRQPAHARHEGRRRLGAARREDVDLARQPRQRRADLRPDRPGAEAPGPGLLSRRHRPARLRRAADPSQDGPARLGHGVDRARRRLRARRRRCSARSARASRSR